MASLSSLFNIGGAPKSVAPAAAIQTSELPKQIAPYYEKLLKEAEALYKQKMDTGAPIYEGKTIAGYTPEQEQLFSGLQSLQGTQAPKFAEAEALTRGTAAKVTPDEVQEYMNPYQQAVVDIEKREAEKQYQSTVVPQLAAQAAAAGSFGGSRQGILEGMASESNQRLQADIQAKGSAQAYQDAMSNINQQRQREGAAAGQLAQLAPAGFSAQAQELGALGKVGDSKQQQQQLALDEAYKQYIQEQQFPSESLKEYQSYVQSFPNMPTQITRVPAPQQPGLAQSLLGLGTAAVGTYGAFGGFSPGGFMGMKTGETGGGISGLPIVYRQGSGKVNPPGTAVSRFLRKNIGEPLGIPGFVDEEDEKLIGRGIDKTATGLGTLYKNVKYPIDLLTGDDPTLFGIETKSIPEQGGELINKLFETKGDKAKRIAGERFEGLTEEEGDELNRLAREQNKGKPPSVDPVTETSPEAKLAIETAGSFQEAADRKKLDEEQRKREAVIEAEQRKKLGVEQNKITEYENMLKKIGPYEDTDIAGVTAARKNVKSKKQNVIDRLTGDKENQQIRDDEVKGISLAGVKAAQSIMQAPNLLTAITQGLGKFAEEGSKSVKTAKDKKEANRNKAEAIGLEIAQDDVATQEFLVNIKDKDKRNKVAQTLNIISTGGNLSNAKVNLINAETDRQYKKEKVKIDRLGKFKVAKDVTTSDINQTEEDSKRIFDKDFYTNSNTIATVKQIFPDLNKGGVRQTIKDMKADPDFISEMSSAYESHRAEYERAEQQPLTRSKFIEQTYMFWLQKNPDIKNKALF